MNKSLLMLTAGLFAVTATIVTTQARAEFKAELKTDVKAKNVTQVGISYGKGSVVQNNVGGIAANGLGNATIKLDTKVKTGNVVQVGVAYMGTSMQSNLGSVTVNAK
jgi:hypothetical protein